MARHPVTAKSRAASRRNMKRASMSRIRSREPRRIGLVRRARKVRELQW